MMSDPTPLLIILFHGVGSSGDDIARLGDVWQKVQPHIAYEAPNGIMPGPQNHGYAWFSIAGVTDDNRPDRIEASHIAFDAVVQSLVVKHGFTDRLDRVAFVGFSQGSMMALDAVASGRWKIAGVLAYSGRLATRPPFHVGQTRIRLIHGDADRVVSVNETIKANDSLRESGFAVETTILPNLDHSISLDGIKLGQAFLSELSQV